MKGVVKKLSCASLIIGLSGLVSTVSAEPLINYPGTAARGMAGSYVAIAKDSSAGWYNPAGLAQKGTDMILEYSSAPEVDLATGDISAGENTFFLAGKISNGNWGFGVFFYEPYLWDMDVNAEMSNGDIIQGSLNESLNIFSVGGAKKIGPVSIGITGEVTFADYSGSDLTLTSDEWGWTSTEPIDTGDGTESDTSYGYSGSIGVLVDLPVDKLSPSLKANLGAVYRLKSDGEEDQMVGQTMGVDEFELAIHKPSSWDVGGAVEYTFSAFDIGNSVALSMQYGETDYSDANDMLFDFTYEKLSFGLEYIFVFATKEEGENAGYPTKAIALRTGYYTSEPTGSSANASGYGQDDYWADVSAVTLGASWKMNAKMAVEAAYEMRDLEYSAISGAENDDVNLFSMAFTWSF